MKPIKNKKRVDPRYFLNETVENYAEGTGVLDKAQPVPSDEWRKIKNDSRRAAWPAREMQFYAGPNRQAVSLKDLDASMMPREGQVVPLFKLDSCGYFSLPDGKYRIGLGSDTGYLGCNEE